MNRLSASMSGDLLWPKFQHERRRKLAQEGCTRFPEKNRKNAIADQSFRSLVFDVLWWPSAAPYCLVAAADSLTLFSSL
eukprot:1409082-Amphidinium_carterae.2